MSYLHRASRSILYQNQDKTLTLLDIPNSISEAQGTPDEPCMDILFSLPPLEKPYPSIEPQSQKAMERVQASLDPRHLTQPTFPQHLLFEGLVTIRAAGNLMFCSERKSAYWDPSNKLLKSTEDRLPPNVEEDIQEPGVTGGLTDKGFVIGPLTKFQKPLRLPCLGVTNKSKALTELANRVAYNPFPRSTQLSILDTAQEYKIPPLSTFMLSKVGPQEASILSSAAYKLLPEPSMSAAPGQFDFIVLDPPWNNKSVRRSKHYGTQRKVKDNPLDVLQAMLGQHIAPSGLVACWITNKPSARYDVLQAFEAWSVELVEEWAWLKTTVHGDPVYHIDGIMRRPYEILLISRSIDPASDGFVHSEFNKPTEKRRIVGVPDNHSRKPSLKALIEPMMVNSSSYRALEVFARNLTAGWWSWGDEVLKYNWEGYWSKAESLDTT